MNSLSRIASVEMPFINYDKCKIDKLELQNLLSNPQGIQLKKIVMPNSDFSLYCDLSGTDGPYNILKIPPVFSIYLTPVIRFYKINSLVIRVTSIGKITRSSCIPPYLKRQT
ncbi:hypothetical protein NPIL_612611 [Nephila pilipes]|uniref:Uncharacterized protein n=1 Tax=Nephila pilipes TaxID=299642 RepID=A0A8X6TB70_NEPPI|nr:hypothetical protein NPIL_612611 [Nephila pilipes]